MGNFTQSQQKSAGTRENPDIGAIRAGPSPEPVDSKLQLSQASSSSNSWLSKQQVAPASSKLVCS